MALPADKHGEAFLTDDDEFIERNKFVRSFLKTMDFAIAKDGYKYKSATGTFFYVYGIYFLHIIMLNIVIALVSD